ncbi:MAG: citrate lyase acyl carrier protein [bacterium]|nr:citrate lyase acyl carrier protein [bacterium]
MKISTKAEAGTLESGDIHVEVESKEEPGVEVDLDSTVMKLYGRQITNVIKDTVKELGVDGGVLITATDKGALDCTVRARVKTAIYRACESKNYTW